MADIAFVAGRGDRMRVAVGAQAHCQALHVLISIRAGSGIETRGRTHTLEAQRAYLVDLRCEHVLTMADGFEHLSVYIPPAHAGPARALLRSWDGAPLPLEERSSALLVAVVKAAFEHAPTVAPHAASTVAQSIVELLNAALARIVEPADRPCQSSELHHRMRIYQHAAKVLTDPELNVGAIAVAVGLSVRRVHQVFASAEMPLMRWVWAERLAQCHYRLTAEPHRGKTIAELSYEWGFNDPAHFSRAFKKRYGQTPSQCVRHSLARTGTPTETPSREVPMRWRAA